MARDVAAIERRDRAEMTEEKRRRTFPIVLVAIALTLVVGGARWYQWSGRACCTSPRREPFPPAPMPNDFALEMESGTGTVAPKYHYSYSVRIDASGRGDVRYWPGYQRLDSLMVRDTFLVAPSVLDSVSELALRLRNAPGSLPSSEQPVGGHSPRLTITAAGVTTTVEPYQPSGWSEKVMILEERMRSAIPSALWARCEQAQHEFASSLEEGTRPDAPRH